MITTVLFSGCALNPDPGEVDLVVIQVPSGAYRFRPYAIYETWLNEVNECAGTSGRLDDIDFYAVPRRGFFLYGGGYFAGYFDKLPEPDRIYLVEHDRENEGLVKHELLHQEADTIGVHSVPPYDYCGPMWYDDRPWRKE